MAESNKKRERRWMTPSTRGQGYAEERKLGVHKYNKKKQGDELDEYQKGVRSGYLLCQSDHAGAYKYSKALSEGKTKAQAKKISREIGGKKENK